MSKPKPQSTKTSPLNLDRQICHSLYSAANALVRAYRPQLEKLNLTYPQYVVMMSLWQRDDVSISELAQHTRFDAGTLTPLLRRLNDKGFIKIATAVTDERRKIITVSRKGLALKKTAEKIYGDLVCAIDMSVEDGLKLKELCELLVSKLSIAGQRGGRNTPVDD